MEKRTDIIFGIHPVLEALKSGKDIQKILLNRESKTEEMREIRGLAAKLQISFQFVPNEKLNRITGKNHQGVIAISSPVTFQTIEHLLPQIFEKGVVPLVILLDRITDVMNFGAIIRSAECAGAHTIIVPDKNTAQINSDAVKSSAGALFNIPLCRSMNLTATIRYLKESGLVIIACTEKSEKSIYEIDYSLPTAIVVGSEEDGISKELLELSDAAVRIPMQGKTASLNSSVAAGIILFEALRQRTRDIRE